ncbi:MAG: aspartate kinase [Prevotellaceae bacterium]|jgi:aspartate kinase|nr:aspartate kinase [Prevotellaceae bacterium]
MKVYKFGGASVRSAEGVRNIVRIVSAVSGDLFIVVSAMGKTTNALETVLENFMKADREAALEKLSEIEGYHRDVISELFTDPGQGYKAVKPLFDEIRTLINNGVGDEYDRWYDRLVSCGEIISTRIVSAFFTESGMDNVWLDMRKLLVTDSNFREANVRMEESEKRISEAVDFSKSRIYIGQGFIGANTKGDPTTLGREGSDYSAAIAGNLLNAESVTIWKDVPGILNADPRIFPNTALIPELTYHDAVELAYSGAQIIHPKTIKPLQNKLIPLYVRPFGTPDEAGSIINETAPPIAVPVLILRKNQVLVTMRPRDFSFVLEESLTKIFAIMNKRRLKVSLIQSSAVSISVCVDNTRYLLDALDEMGNDFKVSYNDKLELLTIRGRNDEVIRQTTSGRDILLSQKTRRIARFLMREEGVYSL